VNNAPEPVPREGQVLCDVYTAYASKFSPAVQLNFTVFASSSALNFFDILQAQGKYQSVSYYDLRLLPLSYLSPSFDPCPAAQPPFPFVGGAEFAGRVSKDTPIPPDCPFKPGDRVFGSCQGAFAEKVAANWQQIFPIPKGMSYNEAAGLFVTWPTSYEALVGRAELKTGK
jgi:NADPH2:quinone reductase